MGNTFGKTDGELMPYPALCSQKELYAEAIRDQQH